MPEQENAQATSGCRDGRVHSHLCCHCARRATAHAQGGSRVETIPSWDAVRYRGQLGANRKSWKRWLRGWQQVFSWHLCAVSLMADVWNLESLEVHEWTEWTEPRIRTTGKRCQGPQVEGCGPQNGAVISSPCLTFGSSAIKMMAHRSKQSLNFIEQHIYTLVYAHKCACICIYK